MLALINGNYLCNIIEAHANSHTVTEKLVRFGSASTAERAF